MLTANRIETGVALPVLRQRFPSSIRRDGRVAEGARLESVFRGNSNVGSNPTLSASPFILLCFHHTPILQSIPLLSGLEVWYGILPGSQGAQRQSDKVCESRRKPVALLSSGSSR